MDKHSSLVQKYAINGRKKFYNIGSKWLERKVIKNINNCLVF
jgi:hypothetical protein